MKLYIRSSRAIKHVDTNYGKTGEVSSYDMLIYIKREIRSSRIFDNSDYEVNYVLDDSQRSKDSLNICCTSRKFSNSECAEYLNTKLDQIKHISESIMIDKGYGDSLDHLNIYIYEGMDGFKRDLSRLCVEIKFDSIS